MLVTLVCDCLGVALNVTLEIRIYSLVSGEPQRKSSVQL